MGSHASGHLTRSEVMRWTLDDIARAVGGSLHGPGSTVVDGMSIDSRALDPGQMFVAIRAGRDGHDFLGAAAAAGAPAALVDRSWVDASAAPAPLPIVSVDDTAAAMLDLGRAARARLAGPVVGITGSVGKTSTKDMAAAALAAGLATVASPRSFNNELGVPLTLVNAPEPGRAVVLEMGARGPGHIALLCSVAAPSIGVVTAVAAAHTEMFGGLDGVARAKGEIVEALPGSGAALLNGDDPRVAAMATRTRARVLLWSSAERPATDADVTAERIRLDAELRPSFRLRSPWGDAEVTLEARGAHQVGNALAALAIAGVAGVDIGAAVDALRRAGISPWRMELSTARSGGRILNDAYNANPASMAAALRALAELPAARRVAVLGPMAELGDTGPAEHRSIAELADGMGIEVVAWGSNDYGRPALDDAEAVAELIGPIRPGVAVLVKGSRVAALEKVATRLSEC